MKYALVFIACLTVGFLVALGVSQGGKTDGMLPIFMIGAAVAFLVNWLAFIPALIARTEKYYDLTGMITYLSVIGITSYLASPLPVRAVLVAALVSIWTLRLGSFLFSRISRDGGDSRFDEIKTNTPRFLNAWTLQGLWVLLTSAAAVAVITSKQDVPLGIWAYVGLAVWVVGFAIEVIADQQKSAFRKDYANKGKFISSGLWAWSRHPNYFGEIMLWVGIAIIAVPVLSGWQWVAMISPVFVYLLLTKVSGVPMLEAKSQKKWGDDPRYQEYVKNTPVLMMRPPKK
ncbi:MAG: DUF1295 domain-containing protein [Acidimicrobiales bacterium]|nr:DUF1295 domain-containing protein [Hyphomonadaceae bacterium]RZV43359.1 MAG: DUF1295 domain-containing protein [Acidimicrobiales bacterium]